MESLKRAIILRDGISPEEAEERIEEAAKVLSVRLAEGETPYDFCEEFFGLEPDYLPELLERLL